ncbi:MAG TPA: alkaline phosphatase family protein [Polyangiaceae bacterium]|nr:alkaline phosphatase family protein [Polyangiaceae bacterium]
MMSTLRHFALCVAASSVLAFGGCFAEPSDSASGSSSGSAGVMAASGNAAGEGAGGDTSGGAADDGGGGGAAGASSAGPKTVLLVLEGLRPELVSEELTPNLWRIAEGGVRFSRVSSVLPSNRLAAAASLATGTLPGRHGVLGEHAYWPGAVVRDSAGRTLDTSQPIDLEDRGTLESLQQNLKGGLLRSRSLVEVAASAGFRTAVIGRSGPASVFDLARQGWVLDDSYVYPHAFADVVLGIGLGLPAYASTLFPDLIARSAYQAAVEFSLSGALPKVDAFGPNPRPLPTTTFLNPLRESLHTFDQATQLESATAERLLGESDRDLIVLWMRAAGEAALRAGPASLAAQAAVTAVDGEVGALAAALPEGSNLVIASDGGTSALAGDSAFFPRWGLNAPVPPAASWVSLDTPGGIPVDGAVRLVDLLTRAGFKAYDGKSCLSGHAYSTYPKLENWPAPCAPAASELTGPALVPGGLADEPSSLVVVSNGASEHIYLPSHRISVLSKLVTFLQGRPEVGALFVAPRYRDADLPGTLDLSLLGFPDNTLLDLLVTYAWNPDDRVAVAPLFDAGVLQKTGYASTCSKTAEPPNDPVPCRGGLYCDTGSIPWNCKFCPPDQAPDFPVCNLSSSPEFEEHLAEARAESRYQKEGEPCERPEVCAAGLRCIYQTCRQPGSIPNLSRRQPDAVALLGSSYGAMAGARETYDLADGAGLVADYAGVRGGASPADLGVLLIMAGPAFKQHSVVDVPSGIIDVAPTLLHVLKPGLEDELNGVDGRLLQEALTGGGEEPSTFEEEAHSSTEAHVPVYSPSSAESSPATLLKANGTYSSQLTTQVVTRGDRTFTYLTRASATRSSLGCETAADCPSGIPCGKKGVCLVTPSCVDGVKNGLETDVDCGRDAGCLPCAAGSACKKKGDCDSGWDCPQGRPPESRICVPALCADNRKSGFETDVDCGHASGCGLCAQHQACLANEDCESAACSAGHCE